MQKYRQKTELGENDTGDIFIRENWDIEVNIPINDKVMKSIEEIRQYQKNEIPVSELQKDNKPTKQ